MLYSFLAAANAALSAPMGSPYLSYPPSGGAGTGGWRSTTPGMCAPVPAPNYTPQSRQTPSVARVGQEGVGRTNPQAGRTSFGRAGDRLQSGRPAPWAAAGQDQLMLRHEGNSYGTTELAGRLRR